MGNMTKESHRFNEKYDTEGEAAKDLKVAVGSIGCPNCGVTRHGAIYTEYCQICGKSYFKQEIGNN